MTNSIEFGSVCSGIEAASVAFKPLGWRAAWFSEIEPFPCAVLAHHYPTVPNHGDMTTLPARIAAGEVSAPAMLCGGTPCQAFSVAGKRESLADARGNLSLTFCEIADAIDAARLVRAEQPCIVLWENVPGVLSTKDNAFGCFLAQLCGGDEPLVAPDGWTDAGVVCGPKRAVAWRVLDAQFFGLAQRRRRVFVVASAREGFDPAAVLLEFDGVRRDSAPRREAGEGAAGGAADGVGAGCWWDGGQVSQTLDAVLQKGQTMPDKNRFPAVLVPEAVHTLRGEGFDASEDGTGRGTPLVPVLAGTLVARNGGGGFSNSVDFAAAGYMVPVAFDTTQITSAANYSNPKPGDPCHPLAAGMHPPAIAFMADDYKTGAFSEVDVAGPLTTTADRTRGAPIAFSAKDYGADAGEIAPALRVMGHDGSHANGGGQVAVAFQSATEFLPQSSRVYSEAEVAPTLQAAGSRMGNRAPQVAQAMAVRRLTTRECERLQGFQWLCSPSLPGAWQDEAGRWWSPDYTAIPWRNKPASECPDGPRYKALGNSWAVPCVRWIGKRINAELRTDTE